MATAVGRTNPSVEEQLLDAPWDFEFYQAVRLLGLINPKRDLVSAFGQRPEESVRFHANPTILFPPSAIQDIQREAKEGGPLHMTVNFMGLTGPAGVLPVHYTEYLIARRAVKDQTAIAFFDLFNHRLISLLYLAWEKHHFPIAYERESISLSSPRRFTQYLFDLIGMGTSGLSSRLAVNDSTLLFYSGLIAQRPRSAVALSGILRDFFQVPVEVEQFIGTWLALETENLSHLDAQGDYGRLGEGAIAGDRVWNQQARFRIRIGPLDWPCFNTFLPGSPVFRKLVALANYFANQAADFDVNLVLRATEVPCCTLMDNQDSPRLGLSSWLRTTPFQENAEDMVITVGAKDVR